MIISNTIKKLIVFTLALAIILTIVIKKENWNLAYLNNPLIHRLEGELRTEDDLVVITPLELKINHKGITVIVEVKLSDDLIEDGFYVPMAPDLYLQSFTHREGLTDWISSRPEGTRATRTKGIFKESSIVYEYFYSFKDISYIKGDSLALNYASTYIQKDIEDTYPLEEREKKYIQFEGLGEYEIYLTKGNGNDRFHTSSRESSQIGHPMSVTSSVYSIVNDTTILTKGGEGSGTGSRTVMMMNHTYEVDPIFWEGQIYIRIYSLGFRIEPINRDDYPTLKIL